MKVNKEGQSVSDTPDDPLFWILREAYSRAKGEEAATDKEIGEKVRELEVLQRKQNAAKIKRESAEAQAAKLGWSLVMKWETPESLKRSRSRW